MMLDSINRLIYRFKKADSLQSALQQVTSPKLVDEVLKLVQPSEVIETIAHEIFIDPYELLALLGAKLELPVVKEINPVSDELIAQAGFSKDVLEEYLFIPQKSAAGYCIIISDPRYICVRSFKQKGIKVFLGLGSSIRAALNNSARGQLYSEADEKQSLLALEALCVEALGKGSNLIILSQSGEPSYSFSASGKTYSGKIHPSFFGYVLKKLEKKEALHIAFHSELISSITIKTIYSLEEGQIEISICSVVSKSSRASLTNPTKQSTYFRNNSDTILIVEDDSKFSLILRKILESADYTVITAPDACRALSIIEEQTIALTICDIHMPEKDGIFFVEKIKELKKSCSLLMLTSDTDESTQIELINLGIDAFVRKQDNPKVLLAWVQNLLSKNRNKNHEKETVSPTAFPTIEEFGRHPAYDQL